MPAKKEEEFELVPLSPLRKLEKRIEALEASSIIGVREILEEMRDIMKLNTKIIEELSKANDVLRVELMKLVERLEKVSKGLEEFLAFIKEVEEEGGESEGEGKEDFAAKINELIDLNKKILESNQAVLNALEEMEKKMRRPVLMRKFPQKVG